MAVAASLTETEVKEFVVRWFHNLDIHASLEEFLSMVADSGIEFRFPEVTVTDQEGLSRWYQRVTSTFFNEIHTTQELAIMTNGDQATVEITTHWQASVWNPPAARSETQTFLAGQTWIVRRSERTGQLVVVKYVVNTFDPVEGSGTLQVKA